MPIHNLGYREWTGRRESGRSRWAVIAGIGIRRAWQSKWLRRIAFVVWGPPLAYGILIFFFEQMLTNNTGARERQIIQGISALLLPAETRGVIQGLLQNLPSATSQELLTIVRPVFWKSVLLQLQRSQSVALVIVVGLITPPLISQDVRSRAFLLYFSRPLTRLQYIVGKSATVAAFLLLTCTLPQLLLYVFAVLLSPDISVMAHTWDLPLRTLAASIVTIVPTTMLALSLSSLTTETRFATFGWFTIWIFGLAAYAVISGQTGDTSEVMIRVSFLFLLFSDISTAILNIPATNSHLDLQVAVAAAITIVSTTVIFQRVSAPLKA